TYLLNPPDLQTINPTSGPEPGGTSVTLTGTDFQSGATVSFGGNAATNVTFVNSTSITCDTPAGTGTADVVITNPDTQSDTLAGAFTYVPPPTVTSINPSSGPITGGTPVTITGTDFQSGATVTIGASPATNVAFVNATTLTCDTPAGAAGAADVVVTNPDSQADTLAGAFTFVPPPTVSSINPVSGPTAGGTSVTITGTDFVSGATVTIGGNPATNVAFVNATTITCDTPAGTAGTADVTVTNPDTQADTLAGAFTYVPPPSLTSINPTSGPTAGGTNVTLTGTDFQNGATVTIGGNPCTNYNYAGVPTTITCDTPAGSVGPADVVITNPDTQTDTLTGGFTYVPPPVLTTINPTTGPTAGGTAVTLTGSAFQNGATVTIGGSACTNYNYAGIPTQIQCDTPTGLVGPANVVVTNPDTQFSTLANGFIYTASPWVPTSTASAPTAGGGHTAVWTGREMIVWGGYDWATTATNSGGRYDPVTDSWTATSTSGAPQGVFWHTAVWSGKEMIVWGGNNVAVTVATGGRYDPVGNSWAATTSTGAPAARYTHVAVWTGRVMIVWAGWGGSYFNTGGRYDPIANAWTATSTAGAPSIRNDNPAVWTGKEMIVWGGRSGGSNRVNTGGRYDPISDTWTATSTTGAPTARNNHTAVWTGTEMIVWAGEDGAFVNTGGRYDP
ncbi:MAG: IPT/TIG domain-containing protein, partial [Planctomycetota bacterium]